LALAASDSFNISHSAHTPPPLSGSLRFAKDTHLWRKRERERENAESDAVYAQKKESAAHSALSLAFLSHSFLSFLPQLGIKAAALAAKMKGLLHKKQRESECIIRGGAESGARA
jgi:hypothetical protein